MDTTDTRIADALAQLADALSTRAANEPLADRLLSVDEARQRLGGISRSAFYTLMNRRQIRTMSIGARRFVPESEVAAFIDRGLHPVV